MTDSIVETTPRSPSITFTDPETAPSSVNSDSFMEKSNGIYTHEEAVKPVQVDMAANGEGISGDHALNGTNGVKISSTPIPHLGDTSLPPAAIEVSLEESSTITPWHMQLLTWEITKTACHRSVRIHQFLAVKRNTRLIDQCYKCLGRCIA